MKKILLKFVQKIIKFLIPISSLFSKKNIDLKKCNNIIKNIYNEKEELFKKEVIINKTYKNFDLSIIVPVYNSERYLKKCLESLLNQKTKYSYEVILINDGSTDNSLSILNEFSNKSNVFKVINQENKGISMARNTGLNEATGKYVSFIDNDDYVSENYIEKLLNRALKNNADIVKCNYTNFLGETGEFLNTVKHKSSSISGYMNEKILEYSGYIWGCIIKRRLWDDFRFPEGFWYEDSINRLIIMRKCKKFEYIDESLYFYNIHSKNASKFVWNKSNIKSLDQYFLIKKLVEYGEFLKLPKDKTLYRILLSEYTTLLYQRTRKLNSLLRKSIFFMACDYIKSYRFELENTSFSEKYMDKSMKDNNYIQYKLVSLYNLLIVFLNKLK